MNEVISKVLRTGLYLSLAVIVLGLVLVAAAPPQPAELKALPVPELVRGLAQGHGVAVLDLGLILLMLTPVARVIAALVSFSAEGNRRFAWISLGVLLVLTVSVLVAVTAGVPAG
ncbi:MAG: DUF1634 domain-containing protein [Bacillota bacterium]